MTVKRRKHDICVNCGVMDSDYAIRWYASADDTSLCKRCAQDLILDLLKAVPLSEEAKKAVIFAKECVDIEFKSEEEESND